MTKEQIFTEIQNIVSANPVLVIGSGASVPYNIPGMNTLAAELKDFLGANPYKNPDSKKAVHEFIENLNHGMELEKAPTTRPYTCTRPFQGDRKSVV